MGRVLKISSAIIMIYVSKSHNRSPPRNHDDVYLLTIPPHEILCKLRETDDNVNNGNRAL